jgi:cell division septum initiation protein DivIVA
MDIQHLLDRLEALLSDSRRIGGKLIVDAQRSWDLIDQMRISVPEEVKQAQRVNQERDRIIAQAKEEAGRIIELARQDAGKLTEEHEIARQAQELATTIEARARRDADRVQLEADEYVMEVLAELDADLARTLTVVRNGIEKLRRERQFQEASEPAPSDDSLYSE